MIPIRRRPEQIPEGWLARAAAVTRALREAADDPPAPAARHPRKLASQKRKELIKKHEGLWSELKEILARWSYGKCWYSEAREIGSDYHVDHFRPKGRVTSYEERQGNQRPDEGYWWLAFEWENYRLSCGTCNSPHASGEESLGKWDYFPLRSADGAAWSPDDALVEERALLLDPVKEAEAALITFNEKGEAVPSNLALGEQAERVRSTIKILNLNSPRFREERRRIWRETSEALEDIVDLMAVPDEYQDHYREAEIEKKLRRLRRRTAPDRELCAAARAAIKKSGYDWAIEFLAPLDGSVLDDPEGWADARAPAPPRPAGPGLASTKASRRASSRRKKPGNP
jgi:uncharacterized protein (TIGR02646 family)